MALNASKLVGALLVTITAKHYFLLSIFLRYETLIILLVIGGFLMYTRWLTSRYRPLMQGQKLEHCTIVERYKFTPPKFMNRGFSDIPKFPGGTWRWKHQNFSFFACCGLRPYMEDRMHYMNDPHHNLSIFSIFDGHGGPFVSQYLEEHFSNAIRNRLLKFGPDARRQSLAVDAYDTVTQAVVTEVHNIDDAISRLDPSLTSFTGSTLISAILEQNRYLTVVNVGDSRAVACDPKGRAIALSADHKPSQAEERRRIENAGGFILEDGVERVQGILSVTRAFGDTQLKRACVLTAHPDVVRVDLDEIGLRFIVVASDGFWDVVSNDEAVQLATSFIRSAPPNKWHKVAEYLVQTALTLGTEDNVSLLFLRPYFQLLANATSEISDVSLLNRITYAYIAPPIIVCGIIGDIMTVITLTHPSLRRVSIIYTYLIVLAITDLMTLLSIIPMILWLLDWRLCSYPSALFYAHVGFPLVNALMGASVWIVVFLTMSQYMAVCHPFKHRYIRSKRMCFWLFAIAYVLNFCIYAPWATKKAVFRIPEGVVECEYVVCEEKIEMWFKVYEWIRETISRLLPFVLVAYFNSNILITYRTTKNNRLQRLASKCQQRSIGERSEQEEKRLFVLLFSIVIVFFVCTIPAAPLTIFVSDQRSKDLLFQITRGIINVMEFTKFALNFYFYCLINPNIRCICLHIIRCRKLSRTPRLKGQTVNVMSQYSRSTRSVRNESNSNRSHCPDEQSTTPSKSSVISVAKAKSAKILAEIIGTNNDAYGKMTIIREGDNMNGDPNERTSML